MINEDETNKFKMKLFERTYTAAYITHIVKGDNTAQAHYASREAARSMLAEAQYAIKDGVGR